MSDSWQDAPIKCKITFDGVDTQGLPLTYETSMGIDPIPKVDNTGKYIIEEHETFITSFVTKENEADTFANPIGVMTSNSASISIFDSDNLLMPENDNSPYYKLMRNGAKLDFLISYDEGITWTEYGTYYATSWSTSYAKGGNDVAIIGCHDKIQYISNMNIPKLPAYSGTTIQELLVNLFIAIDRLTAVNKTSAELSGDVIPDDTLGNNNDYYTNNSEVAVYKKTEGKWKMIFYIDKDLNLSMYYGITVGAKVKETLNSIAQVLTAIVTIDRQGILRVLPSTETYGNAYTLYPEDLQNVQSNYNEANMYTEIEVNYNKVGDSTVKPMVSVNKQVLKIGHNEITGLKFNGKSLTIEDIFIDTDDTVDGHDVNITYTYQGYQDGGDIYVENNSGVEVPYSLVIGGRVINTTPSKVTVTIPDTDSKVKNPLRLNAAIVQNEDEALKYGTNAASHIVKTAKKVKVLTLMSEEITTGDIIIGQTGIPEFDKVYKVIGTNTTHGVGYLKTLDLIETDKLKWSDVDIWEDEAEDGVWKE